MLPRSASHLDSHKPGTPGTPFELSKLSAILQLQHRRRAPNATQTNTAIAFRVSMKNGGGEQAAVGGGGQQFVEHP